MKKNILAFVTFLIKNTRPIDWSIKVIDTYMYNGLFQVITFFYNGKKYKYVGDEIIKKIQTGFFIPIQTATWNGNDVTEIVKPYAGPRHDFFGSEPRIDIMFHNCIKHVLVPRPIVTKSEHGIRFGIEFKRVRVIIPIDGTLVITNILGQQSVFGAK
jgi:hypothetical protein